MFRQVRLRTLSLLMAVCTPFIVCAQSQHPEQPHAKISVEPSGPGLYYGVGILDTDFRFSADVSDATRYILDFGDRVIVECALGDELECKEIGNIRRDVRCELDRNISHKIVCVHRYDRRENYTARLQAFRGTEAIDPPLQLEMRIRAPRPAPEPVPSIIRFSATPSDPNLYDDITQPEADFTFKAYVDDAESYELNFGDDEANIKRNIEPEFIEPRATRRGSNEKVGIRHKYTKPGNYIATVRAWTNTGDEVRNELLVVVQEPLPASPKPDLFLVEPSASNSSFGDGSTDTYFEFSADVLGAERYELDLGEGEDDDDKVIREVPPGSDRMLLHFPPHQYKEPGTYAAVLTTSRTTGGPLILTKVVSVRSVPVEPAPLKWRPALFWALVALAVLLGTFVLPTPVATGTGGVTFEPRSDLGRIRVVGSTTADDAVTMRVRRGAGRLDVKMNDGESQ